MCCVFGCVCVCARVQSCLTLCGPMNCRLPGSSVHAIFQAWILELDPISYSKGSSQPSQGLNIQLLSLLHLQADSLLLCLLESPYIYAVCVYVYIYICCSVARSHPTLWQPHGLQHTRPPCPSPSPKACSKSCHWVSVAIQLYCSLLSPSPPVFSLSWHQGLF